MPLTIEALLASLPARPDPDTLIRGFTPPRRFAGKDFASYRPDPAHPSQSEALLRLSAVAAEMSSEAARPRWRSVLAALRGGSPRGYGLYLDGGFGVGKTHLLAALWNAAPAPKAYLTFDELVHTLSLLGVDRTNAAFRQHRFVAVDEWELDDPGNLKLALAFLRGVLPAGVRIATTSNTLPDELGRGRFDQKSFTSEIQELAAAFETVRIEGEDFRHRRFEADPGRAGFLDDAALARRAAASSGRVLATAFSELVRALGELHPIRYAALVRRTEGAAISGITTLAHPFDALRWVHFIDELYDAELPLWASAGIPLGELFTPEQTRGAYGKKFARCLSRMEEMLGEAATTAG